MKRITVHGFRRTFNNLARQVAGEIVTRSITGRHVYGAHFVMAGGSIYDLQRNLGHHSVAFRATVYGHLSQDYRVKESDRLTGLFVAPAPATVIPFARHGS